MLMKELETVFGVKDFGVISRVNAVMKELRSHGFSGDELHVLYDIYDIGEYYAEVAEDEDDRGWGVDPESDNALFEVGLDRVEEEHGRGLVFYFNDRLYGYGEKDF